MCNFHFHIVKKSIFFNISAWLSRIATNFILFYLLVLNHFQLTSNIFEIYEIYQFIKRKTETLCFYYGGAIRKLHVFIKTIGDFLFKYLLLKTPWIYVELIEIKTYIINEHYPLLFQLEIFIWETLVGKIIIKIKVHSCKIFSGWRLFFVVDQLVSPSGHSNFDFSGSKN
jgi:hypothetical protein